MVVPGIYVQEQQYDLNPLKIDSRCLCAFAGVAEFGPVNEPVLVSGFDEYLKVFGGFDTAGVLPFSVYSYFKNGGKECVVVRIADEQTARCAFYTVKKPEGQFTLTAKTPGKWGNYITVSIWKESLESFSATLKFKNKSESFIHLEYDKSSPRYFETYINEHSSLCRASVCGIIEQIEPVLMKPFYGGREGLSAITAKHFIGNYSGLDKYSGIGCFESRGDISLIAVPDLCVLKNKNDVFAVQNAMISQAERFPGRFAILDIPKDLDVVEAANWAGKLNTSCAAAYFPFIHMTDPLDATGISTVCIPPSGAVCGNIAATDSEKGIFHAPANRILEGAVSLSGKMTTGEQEILYDSKINVLKYFPGRGVKIWGARTLSSDTEWKYINVRRTFSRVCASLREGTQWAVFETNDKKLWKRLVRQVSGFLLDLWRKGYFAGSTPEQGFYVRCDEELNPPENVDKGILTCEVGIAIVQPVEFFKITLTAEKDGASVYLQTG